MVILIKNLKARLFLKLTFLIFTTLNIGCGRMWSTLRLANSEIPSSVLSSTWVSGTTTSANSNDTPTYGAQGVPSTNNSPGTRTEASMWVDQSGNIWLFGGASVDGTTGWRWFNDMWKYTPADHTWTWITGSNAPNSAGSYGTQNVANAANQPPSRFAAVTWVDNLGNFWLFGGSNGLPSYLNDMWMFNPTTNIWTWIGGSSSANDGGTYGTMGTSSTSYIPSSRGDYIPPFTWKDSSGNLWLFGGAGLDNTGAQAAMGDLWQFSPTTYKWTWISGAKVGSQVPAYGTMGVGSTSNTPGARGGGSSWVDSSGNFWLFGGGAYDHGYRGTTGYIGLNDTWKYNPITQQWTWINGSSQNSPAAVFGTMGVGSLNNAPAGAWSKSGSWADTSGNLWLLTSDGGAYNNLWEYNLSANTWIWVTQNTDSPTLGNFGNQNETTNFKIPPIGFCSNAVTGLSNNFWCFSGMVPNSWPYAYFNTLWKITPNSF